jgi:acyl-CoA thioester hydrolase
MGYAYYANYLVWFEVARTSYCRARGFSYADLERETGTFIPVVEAHCRYRRPLRYDDQFIVRTRVTAWQRRGLSFGYEVLSLDGSVLHAEGSTRHVFVDAGGRPKHLPQAYRRYFEPETGTRSTTGSEKP